MVTGCSAYRERARTVKLMQTRISLFTSLFFLSTLFLVPILNSFFPFFHWTIRILSLAMKSLSNPYHLDPMVMGRWLHTHFSIFHIFFTTLTNHNIKVTYIYIYICVCVCVWCLKILLIKYCIPTVCTHASFNPNHLV